MLDTGYSMLVVPVLVVGRSMLVVILDAGCWMLVVPLLL